MATLLRRRDERDQVNDVTSDAEGKRDLTDGPSPVVSSDTSFEEPGSKIWLPYLELADKYDKDLVHNWRDDMDSLLIFAALFSASVTAFVIESYNSLVQDPGEVTISVLLQISQQIANGTHATAAMRPSFQPATIDVAINILWFLSLAFSLTCALAAVLVRQWARQYLRYPRSFSSTSERARARQFVFENMEWWKMDVIVDMIPALLHISLILFFIGLLLFVRVVSYSLAVYLLCFCAIGGAAYSILTIIPLIFSASPYKTPFTGFFGLCMTGGTPLVRTMWRIWRCIVVLFATLEFFLFQVLSSVVRLWSPSFSIQIRKRALELSEPVRSALGRSRIYLREKGPSIKDILIVTGSMGSAVTVLQTYFRRCSQIFYERREEFRNELTIRDAHALRWTMEYSKRDTDLFTIVSSVPEFIQLNDSSPKNVLEIMRISGMTSQTLRLLRLSAGRGKEVANQSAFVSCLESIISLMPCSTLSIQRSGYTLEDQVPLLRALASICRKFRFTVPGSLGSHYLCALSSMLMYCMSALEEQVQAAGLSGSMQLLQSFESVIRGLTHMSSNSEWDQYKGLPHLCTVASEFDRFLVDSIWAPGSPGSPAEFCEMLQAFRSSWVASWMTLFSSLSLPRDNLTWKSVCHGTTHLQHFPHSTPDSQYAMFVFMHQLHRSDRQPRGTHEQVEMFDVVSTYSMVLFGVRPRWSLNLHSDFLHRVRVHGSSTCHRSMKSGEIVVVTHDRYTRILRDHASSHQAIAKADDDAQSDALAHTIVQFIGYRLKGGDADESVSFLVDAQHLTIARALLSNSFSTLLLQPREWRDLIERTAKDFGYFFQLADDYSIEIHAELQYYKEDLST